MSANERSLEKVTAFITRTHGGQSQLLVFAHPTAGIQVPAGTVEPDESPAEAIVREVREETGLNEVMEPTWLACLTTDLPSHRRMVVETVVPALRPDERPEAGTRALRRGLTVSVRDVQTDWSMAVHEEHDYAFSPPRLCSEHGGGGGPHRVLGRRVVRHMPPRMRIHHA